MWVLMRGNKGSITVEMCFVMPVVIWIIMMLIFVILKGLNEGTALGTSQVIVYEYNDLESTYTNEKSIANTFETMENSIVLDMVKGDFKLEKNSIGASVKSYGDTEIYSIATVNCKRERNLCTDRLRRWQLYGNVLCE